jgi:hypothetical protein
MLFTMFTKTLPDLFLGLIQLRANVTSFTLLAICTLKVLVKAIKKTSYNYTI